MKKESGLFGEYGGAYVPEKMKIILNELEKELKYYIKELQDFYMDFCFIKNGRNYPSSRKFPCFSSCYKAS